MTKDQEIQILQKSIKELGNDSYLGPWLKQVVEEVESQIRSDYFPDLTIKGATETANQIISEANIKATEIVSKATVIQLKIDKQTDAIKHEAGCALRQAIRALEN